MDAVLAGFCERIRAAHAARTPLRIHGAGSKDFYGERLDGEPLDTRPCRGIVAYEPSELVVSARCGTPLAQIETTLAAHGQYLAFEPPRFGGAATLGGAIAAGLSGPRRASAGAARDFVLGATLIDARGDVLRFGGQVMKNVAGFDVSRLLCGSLGVLGLIAEVSLKVLPLPHAQATLRFACDANEAVRRFNAWSAQPLPVSATAWCDGVAFLRLSGADAAVRGAAARLGGERLDDAAAARCWDALRDQTHDVFRAQRLWRLSLPSTATFDLAGVCLIEWAGALRWLASDAPADSVRAAAERAGGTATLWRGRGDGTPMFHPLGEAVLGLHRRIKQQFDPHGIFNPGRLVADL